MILPKSLATDAVRDFDYATNEGRPRNINRWEYLGAGRVYVFP